MTHDHGGGPAGSDPAGARWEAALRSALDQVSDLGAEQPPDLGDLHGLVREVQQEQRRATLRDLALFWACAGVVLGAGLYAASQAPAAFLALQAGAGGLMLAGALWSPVRRLVER